jgi:phenylacetate-CoA ligase
MYSFLARHIMAPALDIFRGTQSMKCLTELEESQWWSRDKILDLQNQRLRLLVSYAYNTVPYYRRIFDEIGLGPGDIKDSDDLVKLPILTKRLVRSNFDEVLAPGFRVKDRIQLVTGGSTGQPLVFYTSMRDHKDLCIAAKQRANSGIGFELGDKSASITNRYLHESQTERFWQAPIRFFQRVLQLDIGEAPSEIARKLEAFQPRFISGYPSAMEQVARFIQIKGKLRVRPKAIVSGAEQLYDYQRDLFRDTFGCDTYDFYGSQEEHVIAFECTEHSGHHIVAENVVVEIVDTEGRPAPVGEEGRILITNLHNYAMPLIRYDTGDLGVASNGACPCGRGLPLLAAVNGRTLDMILTRSRGAISGLRLYQPFRWLGQLGVEQCQIVQETRQTIVIKLVISECSQKRMNELKEKVVNEYKRILGEDMDIAVEFVEHIPATPAGKKRIVISHLPPGDGKDAIK